MKPKLFLFVILTALLYGSVAMAQEKHEHQVGKPEELGNVYFPVSCSAAAQKQFERAIAMLHSFWYEEAEKAFAEVTVMEPSCAMGYWGIAMSLYHPIWYPPDTASLKKGWAAILKAKSVGVKTDRERDYVAAIETFYKDSDKFDHRTHAVAYEKAMEKLYLRYPDDREAAAFYALALLSTAPSTDKTYANQRKAARILEKIFTEQPKHPGASHYIIHSFDYPALASLALPAARNYAKIAPAVPHALHMPSHIFTRLGLWQESVQSNLASAAAAKEYAVKTNMEGAWDQQLHAMDYLVYAYLQGAQDLEVRRVLDELKAIQKTEPVDLTAAYAFAAIPARYAIERRRWSEAVSLTPHPSTFPWSRFPFAEAIIHFSRAMGAARSGDAHSARKDVEKLKSLHNGLVAAKESYWADQVEILRREAAAWLAHAQEKNEEALKLLRSAADLEDATEKHPVTPGSIVPGHELLGDLLLELNEPRQALSEFETSLRTSPNRFTGLYGAARAAELMGDLEKARTYYEKLVSLCNHADSERPELRKAKAFLAKK